MLCGEVKDHLVGCMLESRKKNFRNYQNVRIILCIWMDKIFNMSSQRVITIPSQITFSVVSHTQELDSAYPPGGSDL